MNGQVRVRLLDGTCHTTHSAHTMRGWDGLAVLRPCHHGHVYPCAWCSVHTYLYVWRADNRHRAYMCMACFDVLTSQQIEALKFLLEDA